MTSGSRARTGDRRNGAGGSTDWKPILKREARRLKALFKPVTLLALVIIAFATIAAYNIRISMDQETLDAEVALLRSQTAGGVPQLDEANDEKAAAAMEYEDAVASRLQGYSDAGLSLLLIEAASESGVTITITDIEAEIFQSVGSQGFPAKPVTFSGKGEIDAINAFLTSMESGRVPGFEIQTVNISGATEGVHDLSARGYLFRQLADEGPNGSSSSESSDQE